MTCSVVPSPSTKSPSDADNGEVVLGPSTAMYKGTPQAQSIHYDCSACSLAEHLASGSRYQDDATGDVARDIQAPVFLESRSRLAGFSRRARTIITNFPEHWTDLRRKISHSSLPDLLARSASRPPLSCSATIARIWSLFAIPCVRTCHTFGTCVYPSILAPSGTCH